MTEIKANLYLRMKTHKIALIWLNSKKIKIHLKICLLSRPKKNDLLFLMKVKIKIINFKPRLFLINFRKRKINTTITQLIKKDF
jgi:hypothetical protein